MEYTRAILQYSIVLAVLLSIVYTAFFYREVYAKGAIIPRFISIFIFSSVLFLFLNKAMGWEPEVVYHKTVKFFLILSAVFIVAHLIIVLSSWNYSGMNLVIFVVLVSLVISVLLALTGLA